MSDNFPRMKYRKGTEYEFGEFACDTTLAADEADNARLVAEGWFGSPAEAHGKGPETDSVPAAHATELEVQLAESRERIAELEGMIDERDARISTLVEENEEMKALLETATGPKDPDEPAEDEPTEPEPEAAKRRGRPPKVRELADA